MRSRVERKVLDDEVQFYEDELIGNIKYHKEGTVIYLDFVQVIEKYQGKGKADKMMDLFTAWLKEQEYTGIPICSYAKKWTENHPEKKEYQKQ